MSVMAKKKESKIVDSKIYSMNQDEICSLKSKMIFYRSSRVCKKLLNIKLTTNQMSEMLQKSKIKLGCKGMPRSCDFRLEGFYITPTPNINGNAELAFSPLWSFYNPAGPHIAQYLSTKIGLKHFAISNGQSSPNDPYGSISANQVSASTSLFDHSELQFSNFFPTFTQAYIPFYDLLLMTAYSKYIGIVGARVTSGNFLVLEDNNGILDLGSCDKQYFTYRFIGFNKKRKLNKKIITLQRVGIVPTKSGNTIDPSIPGETWALPCPPRWNPEN